MANALAEAPLRDRLLLCLRSKRWRSYRQLCLHTTKQAAHIEVRHELTLMLGAGLIDYWDNSLRRFKLTIAGMNAARAAAERQKRREAA